MCTQARVRLAQTAIDVRLHEISAEKLPFNDCHFDTVVSHLDAVHHPPTPSRRYENYTVS